MKFSAATILSAVWLPPRADRQRPHFGGVSGGLRPLHRATPHWMILLALLSGGFFRSLEFTALNAIGYADIDPARMSRATSFASVSQQMSGAVGVAVAAVCIQIIQFSFGDPTLMTRDLSIAFILVAIVSSLSTLVFLGLEPEAGAAVSGKMVVADEEGAPAPAE